MNMFLTNRGQNSAENYSLEIIVITLRGNSEESPKTYFYVWLTHRSQQVPKLPKTTQMQPTYSAYYPNPRRPYTVDNKTKMVK